MNRKKQETIIEAIQRVLVGDLERFDEIYNLTDAALRSYIGSRYGHLGPDFVDEVAALTHERARNRLAIYDPKRGTSYQSWLIQNSYTVTACVLNRWYDTTCAGFDEVAHEHAAPTSPGPEDAREAGERDRAVRAEVECLPEPERTCVRLRFYERLSRRVAARHLNLTASKVRRIEESALAQLKRRIRKEHIRVTEIVPANEPAWPRYRKRKDDDTSHTTASPTLPFVPGTLYGAEPWPTEE